MIIHPSTEQPTVLAAGRGPVNKRPALLRWHPERWQGLLATAAARLNALRLGRSAVVAPPAPAAPEPRVLDGDPTGVVEVTERTAMLLRIGSHVVSEFYGQLKARYGGLAAAVTIRTLPDILIDLQVHTRLDLADMSIVRKELDRFGAGLAHDAGEICMKINLLKGWGADDPENGPANRHVDSMFSVIRTKEGEEGLSLCRREIARTFLDVREARVHMFYEITGKGYDVPPDVKMWVSIQNPLEDIQLALPGVEKEGDTMVSVLFAALNRLRSIGVEGLTIMACVEGGGKIRNWIEGLARDGETLRSFIYDPRPEWGPASAEVRRHIVWRDQAVLQNRLYARGVESRHLRQAWLYPDGDIVVETKS